MHCEFPYFEDRPHIPVTLEKNGKRARFIPLLDSGADYSVFSQADAMRLGLDWSDGREINFSNADGTFFTAKVFELVVDIEGFKFPARICFVADSPTSIPLLGRLDIFQHFSIMIDEVNKKVVVTSHEQEERLEKLLQEAKYDRDFVDF